MDKQKQIEEMAKTLCENCRKDGYSCSLYSSDDDWVCLQERERAEAFYNAGYRKTFTSSLASDTQAAYKEGYRNGQKEAIKNLIDDWENNNEKYIDFGHYLDELKELYEVLK